MSMQRMLQVILLHSFISINCIWWPSHGGSCRLLIISLHFRVASLSILAQWPVTHWRSLLPMWIWISKELMETYQNVCSILSRKLKKGLGISGLRLNQGCGYNITRVAQRKLDENHQFWCAHSLFNNPKDTSGFEEKDQVVFSLYLSHCTQTQLSKLSRMDIRPASNLPKTDLHYVKWWQSPGESRNCRSIRPLRKILYNTSTTVPLSSCLQIATTLEYKMEEPQFPC